MPTLLVLRHGKSDWEVPYGGDADRPLAKRGRRAAATVGRYLAAAGPVPDLVLTSPARRAHDTVELAMEAGDLSPEVRTAGSLYSGGMTGVFDELRGVRGAAVETVLIAGHEPTWSSLVETLTGARVRFPTAALACVDLFGGWGDVAAGHGELRWFVTPRALQAALGDDSSVL